MIKFAMSLLVFGVFVINAQTIITGDLAGRVLDSSGNPYIIDQDIRISTGKKLTIREGCVFLFKSFTGINVEGELYVEGSEQHPVIFTSIHDGEFNAQSNQLANPFDWNGISILRESGAVSLSNFCLRFSVYGLKSQNPNIKIENGLFRQNGQIHITIADKIHFVQDNIPYTYNQLGVVSEKPALDKTPPPSSASKPKLIEEPKAESSKPVVSKKIKILRYSSLGTGVSGLVAGGIFGAKLAVAYNDLMKTNNGDERESQKYTERKQSYRNCMAGTIISSSLAVLGVTGFAVSFAF